MSIYVLLGFGSFKEDTRYLEKPHENYLWARQYFKDVKKVKATYHPFVGFKENSLKSQTINIDEDGYRISRNNSEKPEVYFLGGSTMFGYGSNDDNTIPSIFSKVTKDTLKVRNLGNGSHTSFQNLLKIIDEIINNPKPKYIISYEGVNEINSTIIGVNSNLKHSYSNLFKEIIDDRNSSLNPLTFKVFLNNLTLQIKEFIYLTLRKIGLLKYKLEKDYYSYDETSIEKAVYLFLDNWKILTYLCKEKKIKLFLFLQPHITSNNHLKNHIKDLVTYQDFYDHFYFRVINEIQNNPDYEEIKMNFFDLSKVLNDKEPYFYDFCHLNPKGNLLITNEIINKMFK